MTRDNKTKQTKKRGMTTIAVMAIIAIVICAVYYGVVLPATTTSPAPSIAAQQNNIPDHITGVRAQTQVDIDYLSPRMTTAQTMMVQNNMAKTNLPAISGQDPVYTLHYTLREPTTDNLKTSARPSGNIWDITVTINTRQNNVSAAISGLMAGAATTLRLDDITYHGAIPADWAGRITLAATYMPQQNAPTLCLDINKDTTKTTPVTLCHHLPATSIYSGRGKS